MPTPACRTGVLLLTLLPIPAAAQDVQWRTDYTAARREARQRGQPLALVFGSAGCVWCKKMQETSFREPRVAGLLNQAFVPLAVDGDRNPSLADAARVQSYPTIILAAPDGKFLRVLEGYQAAEDLEGALRQGLIDTERVAALLRDCQEAQAALAGRDYGRAITMLKRVQGAGLKHPAEEWAGHVLADLERQAAAGLAAGLRLRAEGKAPEGDRRLLEVARTYPGTAAARRAGEVLVPGPRQGASR